MAKRNRGKRKPKLRDLSRLSPTDEEHDQLIKLFTADAAAPIVTAILGQALLENELDHLLRAHFARRDDEMWATLTDEIGPLATFNSKIIASRAFGICNDVIGDCLDTIRKIRNAFAHSKKPLDFSNELIIKELKTISLPTGKRTKLYKDLSDIREFAINLSAHGQLTYAALCMIILNQLMNKRTTRLKAKTRRRSKRRDRLYRNQLARALIGDQQGQPVNYLTRLLENRTADPSPTTHPTSPQKDDH